MRIVMNEKFAVALKQIALLGGINDYIAISSRELGSRLRISQQSASKRILELLEEGLIQRDLGARKQRIKLTKKGVDALRSEYSEYQKIFELRDQLAIRGMVTTGMGEGQYYVTQPGYQEQFTEKLNFVPFEGTLNLKMNPSDVDKLDILRRGDGVIINGFQRNGRTFGEVRAFHATIQNIECAVILPSRSHYSDIMEVLCKYNLRRTLGLHDGDVVEIQIKVD